MTPLFIFFLPQWLSLLSLVLSALCAHVSCIVFVLASRPSEDKTSMTDGATVLATDLSQQNSDTLSPQPPLRTPTTHWCLFTLNSAFSKAAFAVNHRVWEITPAPPTKLAGLSFRLSDLVTVVGNLSPLPTTECDLHVKHQLAHLLSGAPVGCRYR